MDQFMRDSILQRRLRTWLLTTFATLALILVGVGLDGVVA
jgi:hypothetical protein